MLYLLDANVLIDANRDYYPVLRVPEFWDWLVHLGNRGEVKIPIEIVEEVLQGNDDLVRWIKLPEIRQALQLADTVEPEVVARVVADGYAADLNDVDIEKLGRDPFLIAYGLMDAGDRCVVSTEISKPKQQRANRRIPDVCATLGVACCDTFAFVRRMDFSTGWRAKR